MRRRAFVLSPLAALVSCGYRPLRSGLAGAPHVRVVSAHARVPGGAAAWLAEEAATGARAELARLGALSGEDTADRLRIEIVRLDELSEGIGVTTPTGDPGDEVAKGRARGVRLRVIARGVIEGGPTSDTATNTFETTDVEVTELVSAPMDATAWDASRSAAARGLARKVGGKVAREVLGLP